jgi:hypothetical protein
VLVGPANIASFYLGFLLTNVNIKLTLNAILARSLSNFYRQGAGGKCSQRPGAFFAPCKPLFQTGKIDQGFPESQSEFCQILSPQ